MASDKLFGTEPKKIKDSFPSLCALINLLLFCPLPGICVDLFGLAMQSDTSDYHYTMAEDLKSTTCFTNSGRLWLQKMSVDVTM